MLGKLIKYDLKANRNIFLLMYGVLLVIAVGSRIALGQIVEKLSGYSEVGFVAAFMILSYFVALVAVGVLMYVLIIRRFYTNLFGSEGYLSFTLPVTAAQHYFSKVISGLIWIVLSGLVMFGSALIVFSVAPLSDLEKSVEIIGDVYYSVSGDGEGIWQSLYSFFNLAVSLMMVYFAICFGQRARRHRVVKSIVWYFVLSFVFSMINGTVTRAFINVNIYSTDSIITYEAGYYVMNVVVMLLKMVIFSGGSILIMKKKLNLE